MNTLLGLSGTALAWLFYGATIVGFGAILLRLIYRNTLLSLSVCFWTGLASLVTVLQLINLASGINLIVVRSICLLGLVFFWLCRAQLDVRFWARLQVWHKLLAMIFVFWILDRALALPSVYDSGLYHFSSVRWANEQPLPTGLGNLHGRLAFNQSYFLFVSFLNLLPKRGHGHTFANSLLLFFTVITVLEKRVEPTQSRPVKTIILLLGPLLFFFALLFNRTNEAALSSPSPDAAILCLEVAMFSLALGVSNRTWPETETRQSVELTGLFFLSALAVTFKLSSLVFSAGIALSAVFFCIRAGERKGLLQAILQSLPIPLVLVISWFARGVVASGYLVYPMPATACPVSWKVPADQVRDELNWIISWAREPGVPPRTVFADSSWFWPWSDRVMGRPDSILGLCLLGFAALLLVILCIRSLRETMKRVCRSSHFLALAATCTASVAFWFLSAPDPRFLGANLSLLALSVLGLALEAVATEKGFSIAVIGTALTLGFGICLAFNANGPGLVSLERPGIGSRIPTAQLSQKVTDSGLRVWVPVTSDQTWDAPLPATPYFRQNLSLRGKDLASGFYLRTTPHSGPR
jgi:hypothetical protein